MHTELAAVVCATLAVLAAQIISPPSPAPKRADGRRLRIDEDERPQVGARGSKEARVAWAGFACATAAAVGHLVLPVANPVWIVLFAAAIISIPLAAALTMRSDPRRRRDS